MIFVIGILGVEIFEFKTGKDALTQDGKPPEAKDNPGGEFGFGRNDLTAVESGEDRWETRRIPYPSD